MSRVAQIRGPDMQLVVISLLILQKQKETIPAQLGSGDHINSEGSRVVGLGLNILGKSVKLFVKKLMAMMRNLLISRSVMMFVKKLNKLLHIEKLPEHLKIKNIQIESL